jgi:hypothetical protein
MPDRHKTTPKAVRMPDGLLARVEAARADGETVNAFIVAAIERELERREGGSTAPAAKRHSGSTTRKPPAVTFTAPLDSPNARIAFGGSADCPHPKARINKGLCGACGTNVGTKGS